MVALKADGQATVYGEPRPRLRLRDLQPGIFFVPKPLMTLYSALVKTTPSRMTRPCTSYEQFPHFFSVKDDVGFKKVSILRRYDAHLNLYLTQQGFCALHKILFSRPRNSF